MEIKWLPVVGYEGSYEVSNTGLVRSVDRVVVYSNGKVYNYKGIQLKLHPDKYGYNTVPLSKSGCKLKVAKVHRLVGLSFIDNPENKEQINHKDGVKSNNNIGNLEWCTSSENQKHANDTGLRVSGFGEESTSNKVKNIDVLFIREWCRLGFNQSDIASVFGITNSNISSIHLRKSWKHLNI